MSLKRCEDCKHWLTPAQDEPCDSCRGSENRSFFEKAVQCIWRCPICSEQCGGIDGHKGGHQCKVHSRKIKVR